MNTSLGYRNISPITDVKYKGIHPMEKKEFIKETNEYIKDFNTFWGVTMPAKINSKIEKLFEIDANDGENLQELLKLNGVKISTEEIKKAIEENEISKPNPAKVLQKVSNDYCVDLENLLENIKSASQETLKDKTNNVENFFETFSLKDTKKEIMQSCKKEIGKSLAKQFRPILEREKKEKSEKTETKKKLIELINKLLLKINQNNNMSSITRRRSMSSLSAFKKSLVNDDQSAIKGKDASVLKLIIRILVRSDPKLRRKILVEQRKYKGNTNPEQNASLITKQLEDITKSPTASRPSSLTTAVSNISNNTVLSTPSITQSKIDTVLPPPAPKIDTPLPTQKTTQQTTTTTSSSSTSSITSSGSKTTTSSTTSPKTLKTNLASRPKKGQTVEPDPTDKEINDKNIAELKRARENLRPKNAELHRW